MAVDERRGLVRFLRRETGDRLHFTLTYGPNSWELLYLSDTAQELFEEIGPDVETLLDTFREEGERNAKLQSIFQLGWYYCSLHLFEGLVIIHFFQFDGLGVIFGFDPSAAPNLTEFVSLTTPYIRGVGLDQIKEEPAWEST